MSASKIVGSRIGSLRRRAVFAASTGRMSSSRSNRASHAGRRPASFSNGMCDLAGSTMPGPQAASTRSEISRMPCGESASRPRSRAAAAAAAAESSFSSILFSSRCLRGASANPLFLFDTARKFGGDRADNSARSPPDRAESTRLAADFLPPTRPFSTNATRSASRASSVSSARSSTSRPSTLPMRPLAIREARTRRHTRMWQRISCARFTSSSSGGLPSRMVSSMSVQYAPRSSSERRAKPAKARTGSRLYQRSRALLSRPPRPTLSSCTDDPFSDRPAPSLAGRFPFQFTPRTRLSRPRARP